MKTDMPVRARLTLDNGVSVDLMLISMEVEHERLDTTSYSYRPWRSLIRHVCSRLLLIADIIPEVRIEMPFTRHDRFTLAALLPEIEEEFTNDNRH